MLQIATTAVVIGVYAAVTFRCEQRAHYISDCRMVLLASLVLDHHPKVPDLAALLDLSDKAVLTRGDTVLGRFGVRLDQFRQDGSMPEFARSSHVKSIEHLVLLLLAPVVSLLSFLDEDFRHNAPRIRSTEFRRSELSGYLQVAMVSLMLVAIGVALIGESYVKSGVAVAAIYTIGFATALIRVFRIVQGQQHWKTYWTDRLLDIAAIADRRKNQDLATRGAVLSNYVDNQPDLPLPGTIGLYTAIYSGVQVAIIYAARWLALS